MTKPVPRISTRGYYDLTNGTTLKKNPYHLYPKKDFEKLIGSRELTIMIHGLGNDNAGAVAKVIIARNKLRRLGYHYPVIGYSYDSNTTGGHLIAFAKHALAVGQMIARKNGLNLARFIEDFKSISPKTRIRLMGHSLGSQVILSAVERLFKKNQNMGIIESAHFFGASIPNDVPSSKKYGQLLQKVIRGKIVNYYSPTDEVLFWGDKANYVSGPLGLHGATGRTISKYHQKQMSPENHRFASYAAVLKSFP
jgi:pimeloyl-ACP methyl ester carboxylesterase